MVTLMARARAILEVEANKTDKFVSAVLTQASQDALLEAFPPAHPNVYGHHMTMAYKPSNAALDRYEPMLGERLQLRVIGYAEDESGQAVVVDGLSENAKPHITISVADGVGPAYSNSLLDGGYEPISGPELEAIVDIESLEEAEDPKKVLGNLAKGSRFVPEPLSWLDLERLVDIIAMGPLRRLPSDEKLVQKGYVEPYSDDLDSLVAAHGFQDALYDQNGAIRKEWIQKGSLHRYEARENPKSVKRRMRLQDVKVLRSDLFRSAASLRNVGADKSAYVLDALGMMLGSKHKKLAEIIQRLPELASSFRGMGLDAVAAALDAAYEYEMASREVAEAKETPRSVLRKMSRQIQDVRTIRQELFKASGRFAMDGHHDAAYRLQTLAMLLGTRNKHLPAGLQRLPAIISRWRERGLDWAADAAQAAYDYETYRDVAEAAENPRSVMRNAFPRPMPSNVRDRLRVAATWLLMNNYVGEGRFIKAVRYQVGLESGENLRQVDEDREALLREGDRLVRDLGEMARVEPQKAASLKEIQRTLEDALFFLRRRWS
jgi:hypothetical protein